MEKIVISEVELTEVERNVLVFALSEDYYEHKAAYYRYLGELDHRDFTLCDEGAIEDTQRACQSAKECMDAIKSVLEKFGFNLFF